MSQAELDHLLRKLRSLASFLFVPRLVYMYYVYVLFSHKDRKLYIGSTKNLKERFSQHRRGEVESTKNRRPLKLICSESYLFESDAKRREKYLKGGNGRASLKVQLRDQLKTLNYRYL